MNTAIFPLVVLLTIAGTLLGGSSAYAQRNGAPQAIILRKRTPLVKLPPELAAPDRATLQTRNKQSGAAQKFIADRGDFSKFKPFTGPIRFVDPKKPITIPEKEPWSVVLTPANLKTDEAYLELTAPESTTGEIAHFAQKRSPMLGSPDGFFWPDSFASFGFSAKKDHGYLITVKAKKISEPGASFVLFPVADGLGGGTMYTQQPQIVLLDTGAQEVRVDHVVLISKDGWYGFRIGLQSEGFWDLYSVSIKEINSILMD